MRLDWEDHGLHSHKHGSAGFCFYGIQCHRLHNGAGRKDSTTNGAADHVWGGLQGQQRAKRGPTTIRLGDFVPKQKQQGSQGGQSQLDQQRVKRGPKHPQAPTYAQTAAGAVIPVTQASAPTLTQVMAVPDVKSQIISQLQSLTVLMQQVL